MREKSTAIWYKSNLREVIAKPLDLGLTGKRGTFTLEFKMDNDCVLQKQLVYLKTVDL